MRPLDLDSETSRASPRPRLLRATNIAVANTAHLAATRREFADIVALLRFDIARPQAAGGRFETRYRSITHTPLLNDTGEVALVVQHPIDLTEFEQANEAFLRLIGRRLLAALPELAGQGFDALLDEVSDGGSPFVGRGMEPAKRNHRRLSGAGRVARKGRRRTSPNANVPKSRSRKRLNTTA